MQLQALMQSILVSIFCLGLLRLSEGIHEAISLTAANLVSHWERFWFTSVQFRNVRKAFLLTLRRKIIANILRFLGWRESKLVRRNSKKLPKLFYHGFTVKFIKQKRLNALLKLLEGPSQCKLFQQWLCTIGRQRGQMGKGVVFTTTLIKWSGFNPHPGHVVASLDKTLYDDYLYLVA